MLNKRKTLTISTALLLLGILPWSAARDGITVEEGRNFWAFVPVADPQVPKVRDESWPINAIDQFILAKLETTGKSPAQDAQREILIRRIYFDLIGLPPSPKEIEAFVGDDRPNAYPRLVDRLLESPAFGVRWGRHWLDLARYSETTGGGRDMKLPNAWRYRDYVIDAFNRDKPFDRFVTEQLAGDLMQISNPREKHDAIVATGFLALGPSNYENQDKEQLRMDVVDEQINTLGRVFMGMTLGCARCHDHFFDPVPTEDYYALAGILRSTKTLSHANVSTWTKTPLPSLQPDGDSIAKEREGWQSQRDALAAQLAKLEKTGIPRVVGGGTVGAAGIVVDDVEAKLVGDWVKSTHTAGYVGERYLHDKASAAGMPRALFSRRLPKSGEYEVRVSYTHSSNRAREVKIEIGHANGKTARPIDQRQRPPLGSFVPVGRYHFDTKSDALVSISNSRPGQGHVIVDAVAFVPVEQLALAPPAKKPSPPTGAIDLKAKAAEIKKLKAKLKTHDKKKPGKGARVAMSVIDESKIENYAINIGGNPHKLGAAVPRGFLQVASEPNASSPAIPADQSGRLQLALWLTSAQHPLTARVFANRTWYWLTGRGLVASVDNFGSSGDVPSHPELLDHLADAFVHSGWSVKALVRSIVLSRTYQQGSQADPNTVFAGFPTRRLDAESLRDAMLMASAELELRHTPMHTDLPGRDKRLLRSVYLPIGRNSLPESLSLFDFPDPNLSTGGRSESILPTQALYLMNHPWVIERSTKAAARWMALEGDTRTRIEAAYRYTLGRRPDETESRLASEFLGDSPDQTAWAAFQQTLFASISFRHIQ